jgi:hypothetical protein
VVKRVIIGLTLRRGMDERQLIVPPFTFLQPISAVKSPFCGGSGLPFLPKYFTAQPIGALKLKHWQTHSAQ